MASFVLIVISASFSLLLVIVTVILNDFEVYFANSSILSIDHWFSKEHIFKNLLKFSRHLLLRTLFRNSLPQVFLRKGVLKICPKFTEEHPCRSVFSIKMQSNFGMGFLKKFAVHFSEHLFLRIPLDGCFRLLEDRCYVYQLTRINKNILILSFCWYLVIQITAFFSNHIISTILFWNFFNSLFSEMGLLNN